MPEDAPDPTRPALAAPLLEVGYDVAALPGMSAEEIVTPALVIDAPAMERNLAVLQRRIHATGLRLRPHAKTHRSAQIGLMQVAAGAVGLCAQTLSEAEALVRGGLRDVLITNEVRGPARAARLARLAARARIGVCVDDAANLPGLSAALAETGAELDVLVEIDVGGGRCGVPPGPAAVELAEAVQITPGLVFAGLQAYHGRAQHIRDPETRAAAIAAAASLVRDTAEALTEAGLPPAVIGGAGTGSYPFEAASGVWTELQCGSYLFMDADYRGVRDAAGEGLPEFEHALFVLTEVLSTAARPGFAICDAGLKAHATDSGLPVIAGRPDLRYVGASDEHGTVEDPGRTLAVGDRLHLIPGHVDPTVNLHDHYLLMRGGMVEDLIPVDARGRGW